MKRKKRIKFMAEKVERKEGEGGGGGKSVSK